MDDDPDRPAEPFLPADHAHEDDEDRAEFRTRNEVTAFLVDAGPASRCPCGLVGVANISENESWLSVAARAVAEVARVKIINAPTDEVAVFYVGCGAGGPLDLPPAAAGDAGVVTAALDPAAPLAPPSAASVARLDAVAAGGAAAVPPPLAPVDPEAWARALTAAARALAGRDAAARRVTIVTPDAGTAGGGGGGALPSDPGAVARAVDRARTLCEAGVAVDVLAMAGPGTPAEAALAAPAPDSFWGQVLAGAAVGVAAAAAREARADDGAAAAGPNADAAAAYDDDDPDGGVDFGPPDAVTLFRSLAGVVRARGYRRAPLTTLPLVLPGGARAAVALYQLTQPAKPGAKVMVSALNHRAVGVVRPGLGGGWGADVDADPPTVVGYKLKPSSTSRFVKETFPAIVLDRAAHRRVTTDWGPAGFTFLGAARVDDVAPPHLAALRPPTFLYPAERRLPGSTALVAALHAALCDVNEEEGTAEPRDAAVCSFVRREGAAPSLVALIPRILTVDEHGDQVSPEGLDVVYLPWADDVRAARAARAVVGAGPFEAATPAAVAAAAKYVYDMTMEGFESTHVPSPAMQRHWTVLEALALGADPPPVESAPDEATVDPATLPAAAAGAAALREAVGAEAWDAGAGGPKKRKAAAAASSAAEGDINDRVAAGQAGSLTVDQLKAWLKARGELVGGRKADLLARVARAVAGGK